ncbi:type II toxin-antitoxin system VapC family toxin [Bernardetia sp. MNP-M8]|uniref:type II toxin-antitoxin system VapC family toxin n=1 Tax=Bernardetia sp. MNP-M8 TaxID=3127470 RepID=UPI0030CB5FB8
MGTKKVLLDTDILSYYLKKNPVVVANFENYLAEHHQVFISRITVIEIMGGLKVKSASKQLEFFENFISSFQILDTSKEVAQLASSIFAELYKKGRHSGNFDVLNAAIAMANNLAICTNNEKDYENIDGLEILNWTK